MVVAAFSYQAAMIHKREWALRAQYTVPVVLYVVEQRNMNMSREATRVNVPTGPIRYSSCIGRRWYQYDLGNAIIRATCTYTWYVLVSSKYTLCWRWWSCRLVWSRLLVEAGMFLLARIWFGRPGCVGRAATQRALRRSWWPRSTRVFAQGTPSASRSRVPSYYYCLCL